MEFYSIFAILVILFMFPLMGLLLFDGARRAYRAVFQIDNGATKPVSTLEGRR